MLKKFVVGAVAAGALSLPLAGVALGDPGQGNGPNDNGNGIGPGGVPGKVDSVLGNGPQSPGSIASDLARTKPPGTPLPDAVGNYLNQNFGAPNVPTPPGQVVRVLTPGCANGSLGCR